MKKTVTILFLFICQAYLVANSGEKGIGILYLLQSTPTNDNAIADSILILSEKNLAASAIGTFRFNPESRFEIFSKAENGLSKAIEFDYETFGLAVISIDKRNSWYEVCYYENERKKSGFVKFNSKKLGFFCWEDILMKHPLFFEKEEDIKFYKSPSVKNGQLGLNLISNYIMWPLEVKGEWMKVKVVSPSDYCQSQENASIGVYWIKYRNERGQLLVWYFARGC